MFQLNQFFQSIFVASLPLIVEFGKLVLVSIADSEQVSEDGRVRCDILIVNIYIVQVGLTLKYFLCCT